jgi:hypothetical protein
MITWLVVAVPVSGSISRPALIAVTVGVCAGTEATTNKQASKKKNFAIRLHMFLSWG